MTGAKEVDGKRYGQALLGRGIGKCKALEAGRNMECSRSSRGLGRLGSGNRVGECSV